MIQSVVLASAAAGVLTAAAVIGITGLLIAVLLGVAANVFEVPVDEKAIAIRDVLPGPTVVVVVMPVVMRWRSDCWQGRHRLMAVR